MNGQMKNFNVADSAAKDKLAHTLKNNSFCLTAIYPI